MAKPALRFISLVLVSSLAFLLIASSALAGDQRPVRDPSSAIWSAAPKALTPFDKGAADNPQDGSFEDGSPNGFWAETSSGGFDVVCDAACGANGQRTGDWYAWLGGVAGAEISSVAQTVTLGADDRYLSFWTWFEECDSDGTDVDEFTVSFDATTLFTIVEGSPRCTEPGHQRTVIDISAFAGGTYDLEFQFLGAGPAATNIYIDDVQILETLETTSPDDGGFEAGSPNPFWTEASTNFGTPICNAACGLNGQRSGAWWSWFGGTTNFEIGSVSQDIVLAAQDTTLSFWLRSSGCDGDATDADFFTIEIDGSPVFFRDENSELCDDQIYSRYLVDISGFADGASHEFVFTSTSHGPGVSNFFLDDVEILPSLEAYYPFDVDAMDHSPNARHATLEGAAVIGTGITGGGALDLTGGDGWADIVDPVLVNHAECTIAYSIRFESLVPNTTGDDCCNAIFAEDDFFFNSLHNNVAFFTEPDTLEWVIGGNTQEVTVPAPNSTPTNWMHLAMTYNQSTGTQEIYVNGVLANSVSSPEMTLCGSNQSSQIGAWNNAGTNERYVDAVIDEMWIFSRVLSAEEIRALAPTVFLDGFESGDVSAWSSSVGLQ